MLDLHAGCKRDSIFTVHVDAKNYEYLQGWFKGKFFIGILAIFKRFLWENQCLPPHIRLVIRRVVNIELLIVQLPFSSSGRIRTNINASYISAELQYSNIIYIVFLILKLLNKTQVLRINKFRSTPFCTPKIMQAECFL